MARCCTILREAKDNQPCEGTGNNMIYLWITVALCAILFVILAVSGSRKNSIVKKTSERLSKLEEINKQYTFKDGVANKFEFTIRIETKPKLDRYNLNSLVINRLLFSDDFSNSVVAIADNQVLYKKYDSEISQIQTGMTKEKAKELHISYEGYIRKEEALFNKKILKPIISMNINCKAIYTSPKGRNTWTKSRDYDLAQIAAIWTDLQRSIAYSRTEQARREQERAKMNARLRYLILKRDGYKCQICGRTQEDGVKLHVDHIIPVSKGGETKMENLRTLCEDCNLGKGDMLE